jgi:hypothetical protein
VAGAILETLVPNNEPGIGFPIPDHSVETLFPCKTQDPLPDTFEIGLVLGGTVSAGAYTAGVLDYLIEALDAWTAAKANLDPAAPDHHVVIRIMTGTSGGGLNAVLAARALGYAFPSYRAGMTAAELAKNPFYDVWVNQIDIQDLLKITDLNSARPIPSLLCADKIAQVSCKAVEATGEPLGKLGTPSIRSYVEQPLPLVLTLTNVKGVPYSTDFKGESKRREFFVDHADHIRFLVDLSGRNPPAARRPDEVRISDLSGNHVQPWTTIAAAARGTSAFPIGLPAQTISREIEHYRYRPAVLPDGNASEPFWMRPEWQYMIPKGSTNDSSYKFLAIDGGCLNNEPIEIARTWLAGLTSKNDREPEKAHRAVLLVDPFADAPGDGLVNNPGIPGMFMPLIETLVASGRFSTADLSLFTDKNVYSRFLVSAVRGVHTGNAALASSGLMAFMGFMSKDFRRHDFLLGRVNCHAFLKRHFTLHPENKLFDRWTPDQRRDLKADEEGYLPIIPVLTSAAPTPDDWPQKKFNPTDLRDPLSKRIARLIEVSGHGDLPGTLKWAATLLGNRWINGVAEVFGKGLIAGRVADALIGLITAELEKAKL